MRTNKLRQKNVEKPNAKLWRNAPCCMNYVLQNPSMDNSERFNIGSIYYKDQVNKPKKIFTAFERPDLLLQDFRRQIEQVSRDKNRNAQKKKQSRQKQKSRAQSLTTTINTKFYEVPPKNQYRFDRNGIRSNLQGDYNVKEIENRILTARVNFGSSRRMDLSRPLNFFPGPGTYEHEPNKQALQRNMRTHSDFRKNRFPDSQPHTQRNTIRNSLDLSAKGI